MTEAIATGFKNAFNIGATEFEHLTEIPRNKKLDKFERLMDF